MDPYAIVDWADDYSAFVGHLRDNFGPFNVEADAENELEKLRMKENHKIARYIVNFNQLAPKVQWGEAALRRAFYMGLPSRIKDEIARIGKPDTLTALRNVSQSIDARYWERHGEISRETATSSKPDKGSDKKSGKQSDKKSNSGNNNSASTSGNRNSTPTPRANAVASGSNSNSNNRKTTPDLSDKLGKDGKLTQVERQRRMDNNLCLFCGKGGHMARECPRSTSSANKAKGRAAKPAEEKSEATPATDAKK
jgi:hypothetical protein